MISADCCFSFKLLEWPSLLIQADCIGDEGVFFAGLDLMPPAGYRSCLELARRGLAHGAVAD